MNGQLSANKLISLLPFRPRRSLDLFFGKQLLQVQFPDPRLEIHIHRLHKGSSEVDFVGDVESQDDRYGQIRFEEVLRQSGRSFDPCSIRTRHRGEADPKFSDQDQDIEDEAEPAAHNARLRTES